MRKILIIISFLFYNIVFCQTKVVKVLDVSVFEYYYVYKAYNYISKDTILLISSKNDKEFKQISLTKEKNYVIETRLRSAIKISEDKHFIFKPSMCCINNMKIADGNGLPILITDYTEIPR